MNEAIDGCVRNFDARCCGACYGMSELGTNPFESFYFMSGTSELLTHSRTLNICVTVPVSLVAK